MWVSECGTYISVQIFIDASAKSKPARSRGFIVFGGTYIDLKIINP